MVLITLFFYITSISLPFIKFNVINSPILLRRLCAISFLYAGVLLYNTLYIQLIGCGVGLYSGLFQITLLSNSFSLFIVIVCSTILLIWPNSTLFFLQEKSKNILKIESNILNKGNNRILQNSNYVSKEGVMNLMGKVFSSTLFLYLTFFLKKKSRKKEDTEKNLINLELKENYNSVSNINKSNEYCLIIFFNILGALLLVSSADLISMYLSIELQSFGLYILATLYKEKLTASSAGLKYFLLGGLSSCIILLGSGLIYTYTGLTNLDLIYSLISIYSKNDFITTIVPFLFEYMNLYEFDNIVNIYDILKGISIGFLLIFSGFLFKIAASPFHNWAPDVYDESPTLVTIWLTVLPKISILIFLLQLLIGVDMYLDLFSMTMNFFSLQDYNYLIEFLTNWAFRLPSNYKPSLEVLSLLLLLSSLLSLIIGAVVGLSQTRIKRLLAYSTINHVGFLLLALSVFSNSSIESFIFYLFQYTITNLNIFLIILAISYIINFSVQNSYNSEIKETVVTKSKNIENKIDINNNTDPNNNFNINNNTKTNISAKYSEILPFLLPENISKNTKELGLTKSEYITWILNNSINHIKPLENVTKKIININISDIEYINSFKGLFFKNPILSLSLSICLFSFAGVPPLIGFFAKQQILYSSNSAGYFFLSLIAIIVSVISAFYYLKIIKIILSPSTLSTPTFFNTNTSSLIKNQLNYKSNTNTSTYFSYYLPIKNRNIIRKINLFYLSNIQPGLKLNPESNNLLSNAHSFIIGTLTSFIIIFIFNPELILNSIAVISCLSLNL